MRKIKSTGFVLILFLCISILLSGCGGSSQFSESDLMAMSEAAERYTSNIINSITSSNESSSSSSSSASSTTEEVATDESGFAFSIVLPDKPTARNDVYRISNFYAELLTASAAEQGWEYYYVDSNEEDAEHIWITAEEGFKLAEFKFNIENLNYPTSSSEDDTPQNGADFFSAFNSKVLLNNSEKYSIQKFQYNPGQYDENDYPIRSTYANEIYPYEEDGGFSVIFEVPDETVEWLENYRALKEDGSPEALEELKNEEYQKPFFVYFAIDSDRFAFDLKENMTLIYGE